MKFRLSTDGVEYKPDFYSREHMMRLLAERRTNYPDQATTVRAEADIAAEGLEHAYVNGFNDGVGGIRLPVTTTDQEVADQYTAGRNHGNAAREAGAS